MNEQEKTLIAMGAAMGAGCRKCAEGLRETGKSLKIPAEDIRKACEIGLNAKAETVNTMRAAVSSLLHRETGEETACGCGQSAEAGIKKDGTMACLIRLASYCASNSAPDALAEMDEAVQAGADRRAIRRCMAIAGMVREKAAGFSDEEVGKTGSGQRSAGQESPDQETREGNNVRCSCGCK